MPRRAVDLKLVRFVATGLLNTLFGYAAYAALVWAGLPYLLALLLATVAGLVFNYFSYARMVFDGHRGYRVFGKFVAAYATIYAVNAALLAALTHTWGADPYLAQLACLPPGVALGWILMNHWVYKK
jgi:putative flippase GtrA